MGLFNYFKINLQKINWKQKFFDRPFKIYQTMKETKKRKNKETKKNEKDRMRKKQTRRQQESNQ